MIQQTSIEGYTYIQKDLGKRQLEVLKALMVLQEGSNTRIAKYLNKPINCITGRIKELRDLRYVGFANYGICEFTGRRVILWKPTLRAKMLIKGEI